MKVLCTFSTSIGNTQLVYFQVMEIMEIFWRPITLVKKLIMHWHQNKIIHKLVMKVSVAQIFPNNKKETKNKRTPLTSLLEWFDKESLIGFHQMSGFCHVMIILSSYLSIDLSKVWAIAIQFWKKCQLENGISNS